MIRIDGRSEDQLREVKITRNYIRHAEGSVLIEMGDTKVICTATVEETVPRFVKGTGKGWISSEYGMLPRSTHSRKMREASRGKVDGRTQEIQRLIGRTLRSVVNLGAMGEMMVWVDCDVIQADGGTRTASITGSFIALVDAFKKMMDQGRLKTMPIDSYAAAISVGVKDETILLDLKYEEDSTCQVDMNVIMTDRGEIVELQGTGEERPFTKEQMGSLMEMAEKGIMELIEKQKEALGDLAQMIGDRNDENCSCK